MARELDDRELHAEADAEVGDALFARDSHCGDLALGAAGAEAVGNEYARNVLQRRRVVELLGVDVLDAHA